MSVRVAVLGPLRAEVDGVPVDLGRRRQRAVLARLAVADGRVVSTDALIEDLWHGEPPPRALSALQVHVSHLRRVLEPRRPPRAPATVLVSAPPGYALDVGPDGLDRARVAKLLETASTAPPPVAEMLLGEALASWTGPAYGEFADEPWAAAEVARIAELRAAAVEQQAHARLAQQRAAAAVPDLEQLVADQPLRETAVALLAAALHQAGRRSAALEVLARTRKRLAAELGIDPGPQLRAVQGDILAERPHVIGVPAARPDRVPPRASPVGLRGRAGELARLRAAAGRVADGVQIVLVTADAGGGKSALVEAFRAGAPRLSRTCHGHLGVEDCRGRHRALIRSSRVIMAMRSAPGCSAVAIWPGEHRYRFRHLRCRRCCPGRGAARCRRRAGGARSGWGGGRRRAAHGRGAAPRAR